MFESQGSRVRQSFFASTLAITSLIGAASCGESEKVNTSSSKSASTVTFQSGVNGYTSSDDGWIGSQNGGNGANDFTSNQGNVFVSSTGGYETETLIRFNNISIPSGTHVTSATLQLTFEDYYGGNILQGYYVKNAWSPPPAGIGWTNRDSTNLWNTAGAKGIGTDLVSGVSWQDTSWTGTGNVTKTYTLDTATVQGWLNNPSSNQGIILVNNQVSDKLLRVFTSEDTTAANHPLLTINYDTSAPPGCTTIPTGDWTNTSFPAQSGSFTVQFDATPSAAPMDGVIGLSSGAATAFTGLAVIPRFNSSGFIDARNGGSYSASTSIPYTAGTSYHFRLVVDVTNHVYSAYVTPNGGTEQTIGTNFAFRTEQAAVTSLNNWASDIDSTAGTFQICNFQTSTGDSTAPTVTMTAPAAGTVSGSQVTVSATASDNVGVAGVQFLLDGAALQQEDTVTPYSIAWDTTTATNGTHTLSARARDAAGNTTTSSTVTVTVNNPSNCQTAAPNQWTSAQFAGQTASFTATYDATPSAALIDGLVGLSTVPSTAFTDNAVITRFNTSGFIDARNAGAYSASTQIAYSAGVSYHFRVVVNVTAHTYSAYVTPAGGTEQTIGTNFAFRTEQATDTQLNYWNIFTDTAGVNVTLCNFALSAGTGDTTAPTVAMTAPTCGNNCQGTITVSANASDNVGVAGVQFLLDNAPYGSEDTSSPYSIPANTTVIANGPHTFSARARDAAGNTTTAAPVSITITNATTPGSHPRIWLDNTRLSQLKGKAGANDPAWLNLKNKCNSYLGTNATVWAPPTGTDGCHVYCGGAANSSCAAAANQDSACNPPNVCCGYEGSWFYDALLEEALCYRIGLATGDPNTAAWGAKGVDILTNMIIFVNYGGDDGFGIKFFATAEAIGYDWLYPLLSSNQRTSVVNNLNGWIDWFDAHGVGRNSPTSNYFAGYYAAKAYVAIATEGDNANASSYWSDFLNRLQKGGPGAIGPDGNGNSHAGIANYYTNYLDGGGYPQGWEYANVAVRNMTEPMLAALTGKGLDLINDSTAPYHYPINLPEHLMQVTWPSLLYVDDRDDIHSAQTCPGGSVPTADVVSSMYAMLKRWKPAYAPIFHSWAKAVRNNAPAPAPWLDFLFWDENDPSTDYTNTANEPASYLSRAAAPSGTNYAAMRSSWASTATFGSLRAMPYMNDTDNAHEFMDAGALAITRGDTPFLVNPSFMDRCYGTGSQTFYDNYIEDQTVNSTTAPRQFFNIFYTGTSSGQLYYTDEVDRVSPAAATTGITRFEDKNGYVYTQADKLEQMYPSTANITSWTRDVVYLRPSIFVVYDRTVTNGAPVDARMSWNFPPVPTLGTPPSSGAVRYDVNDSVSGFKGSITTVLPASAQVGLSNSSGIDGSGKMYGLDVRPASAASSLQWLTILDASSSSSAVALASIPTGITSNVKGTLLKTSSTNYVVLFGAGAANSAITVTSTQPVSFQEPTGIATKIVVTDMPINTSYSVTLQTSGSNYIVTITPGTGFTTTEYGTLYLSVSSTGTVTNGT